MKDLYIVIIQDRHADTTAHPFTNKETAISEARRIAKEYCRDEEDYEERDIPGWEFHAEYSCEGDNVHVVGSELDGIIK